MAHDVFLSFSTRDRLAAEATKQYLDERGMSCWMSSAGAIDGGELWTRAIVDGINAASVMVLVLTANSNGSEHVRREIYLARERRLRMIPFRLDDVEPDGDLAYNLAGIQWIQGSTAPTAAELARLAASVQGYLDRSAAQRKAAVEPEEAPSDPAPAEPAQADPASGEPALVEPKPADPALADPAPAEPALVEPALVEPAQADPAPAEPVPVVPAPADELHAPSADDMGDLEQVADQRGKPAITKFRLIAAAIAVVVVVAIAVAFALLRGSGGGTGVHVSTLNYKVVSASDGPCGVLADNGFIRCWGTLSDPSIETPSGPFISVSVGSAEACGIRETQAVACWVGRYLAGDTPSGKFTQVINAWIPCALSETGTAVCWKAAADDVTSGAAQPPSDVRFAMIAGVTYDTVAPNDRFGCGVTVDGDLSCWGSPLPVAPSSLGKITSVGIGDSYACAIQASGSIVCWGDPNNDWGQMTPPAGNFTFLTVGDVTACAIETTTLHVTCWGFGKQGQLDTPAGEFVMVSIGYTSVCGVRTDSKAVCWGDTEDGQLNAP